MSFKKQPKVILTIETSHSTYKIIEQNGVRTLNWKGKKYQVLSFQQPVVGEPFRAVLAIPDPTNEGYCAPETCSREWKTSNVTFYY